jgi:hypothetical protein
MTSRAIWSSSRTIGALLLLAFTTLSLFIPLAHIFKLAEIGSRIPQIAQFPPGIDSLPAALASLDAAYHLNHRVNGRIMFDVVTGTITEGIGHYSCTLDEEARSAKMSFDNPYPCDFDRGILLGMGKRFARRVSVEHGAGCRMEGAAQCRYSLRW